MQPPAPPNRSIPESVVMPVLVYPDVRAAVEWLGAAFGCVERLRIGTHRAQLALGGGHLVAADGPSAGAARSMVLVRVADVDAHCRRAAEAGARIVLPPADHKYGERQYTAEDLAGHRWTFSQTIADVDPASWGGMAVNSPASARVLGRENPPGHHVTNTEGVMPRFVDSRSVLAVRDLAKSTRFYCDVLGFERDAVDAKGWSFLSRDAFKLMLGECSDEVPAADTGNHSWFARVMVDGLDEYFRAIAARGAHVIAEPADRAYGLREFVIQTPDGHRLMFAERIGA
jgi:uncharacterized glyoxalase superfamily protein PhnB